MITSSPRPLLVLKIGGGASKPEGALAGIPRVLAGSESVPTCGVAIVHGGGPEVTRWMERLALEVRFKDGLRVTDAEALEVATMVLRGRVSTALAAALAGYGVR